MHTRYQKILIVIFLLALSFFFNNSKGLAFCIRGPIKTIDAPSYELRGSTYVPLILVCESHGLNWKWDPIGKVVILEKNNLEARLKVGSYRAYVNGRIRNLEKPPLIHNGIVVVPTSFVKKTINKIFKEEVVPRIETVPIIVERKYSIRTIVIDPGHGGKDPGAIGRYGLREKDLVLEISKMLKRELEQYGIKVILTRTNDVFISLGERASIANRLKADFFISIHANASRTTRMKGFEVYYLSEATDDAARALAAMENVSLKYEDGSFDRHTKHLDATIWDLELTENRIESIELSDSICKAVSEKLAVRDRGVKSARFYVLKYASVPAILVEIGYISNSKDALSLKDDYYKRKLTEAIADGIISYKREYERTNGFTE